MAHGGHWDWLFLDGCCMRGHARLADVELAPPPHAGEPLVHCPKLATTVAVARERDAMILLELTAAQHTLKFNVVSSAAASSSSSLARSANSSWSPCSLCSEASSSLPSRLSQPTPNSSSESPPLLLANEHWSSEEPPSSSEVLSSPAGRFLELAAAMASTIAFHHCGLSLKTYLTSGYL